jgi:aminoglycoside phosphotransferase (APT) family kinase protein
MTRLPGKDVESLRASLDEQSMERIVAWSGAFLRRLRDIPIEDQERDEAWDASIARLANLRGTAARGLRTRSGLPEHLIEQVEGWLPTGLELLGTKELLTLTHGAFGPGRVIIDIEAGAFEPTGVIDFNASSVTHPMSDFATAWAALRAESTTVVDAFMREAAFPAFGAREFPRRALAWAILQGVDAAYAAPDMDAIRSLDELAVTVFGRANSVAAETGTGAPDLDTGTQGHGQREGGQADHDEDRARGPV